MASAARILYEIYWKTTEILLVEDWRIKIMDFVETDKLTILLKDKSVITLMNNWKPLIAILHIREKMI